MMVPYNGNGTLHEGSDLGEAMSLHEMQTQYAGGIRRQCSQCCLQRAFRIVFLQRFPVRSSRFVGMKSHCCTNLCGKLSRSGQICTPIH